MRRILAVLFWAGYACAQSGIEVPSLGAIVDPSGALRPVQGVAGNFFLGSASVAGVLSAACSERLCLAKTDSKILAASGETDAPPGAAVFGLDGDDAVLFFLQSRKFARWHENTLESLDWAVDGDVLSIRLGGGEAEIAVRRDSTVWVVRPDGAVVDWIADTAGPVLLLADDVLYATPDQLVLRRRNASEMRFDLTGAETITTMGAHYAAIRAGDAVYALRIEADREDLFLLPGSTP
ncbi:MAG: hypothetical protein JWO19_3450 [Bryobacterales bacterium]|nr:hypothetical protein [Bryobacterales bacterium]